MLSNEELRRLYANTVTPPAPDQQATTNRLPSDCLFIHRTAVVMADGEVVTCANMYAENVGRLGPDTPFMSVWNNQRMRSLRASFGTAQEWQQCRHCWFREIRYGEQRLLWAGQDSQANQSTLAQPADYQVVAWDFRKAQSERKRV